MNRLSHPSAMTDETRALRGTIETKYVLPLGRVEDLLALVGDRCLRDPAFPCGYVNTVYFDTPDLRLYGEKRGSDYLKTKLRVRWYTSEPGETPTQPIAGFVEVKRKIGATRKKERFAVDLQPACLTGNACEAETWSEVLRLAEEAGLGRRGRLVPTVHLGYRRHRFLEPATGARISVDSSIHAHGVRADLAPAVGPVVLPVAVLEVKGTGAALPRGLSPVILFGARRAAFSKYAWCLEMATHRLTRRV